MAAASISPDGMPKLSELVGMRKRKLHLSATQLLVDKLESDASLFLVSAHREDLTPADRFILEQCRERLESARASLDRWVKRSFTFWDTIHEVDGLLLLVMPEEMLLARGLEILQRFQRKIGDPEQREQWLGAKAPGPLPEAVQLLVASALPLAPGASRLEPDPARLRMCRHILRGALGVLNEHVDLGFWQLSTNVALQLLSGLLIIGLMTASFVIFASDAMTLALSWQTAIIFSLFGMIGATLSNMLSRQRFVVATGATSRFFGYYLFIKPLIGGFAALLVFLVEQTRMLLQVVVRGSAGTVTSTAVQFNVDNNAQAFLVRAMLGLVAGYFADRVVSSVMDVVLSRMFKASEKTVEKLPSRWEPKGSSWNQEPP